MKMKPVNLTEMQWGVVRTAIDTEIKRVENLEDIKPAERAAWLSELHDAKREFNKQSRNG